MTFAVRCDAVGQAVGDRRAEVSFRMTAAYAAAIGAEDDHYLDDGVAGGPMAPPAFVVVLEWPLLLRQPYIGLIGASEAQFFDRLLHAFQDSRLHRPIRPGDHLHTRAVLTEVRPTSAGALVVCRLDTCCERSDAPVATSWIGSLFRGCAVEGGGACVQAAPPLATSPPADSGERSSIAIGRTLPFVYTEGSGLWNPIHTERAFARAAGHPDLVVHGTATWAMACERLIRAHAGGRPERLRRFGARFSGVLTPGRSVTLQQAGVPGQPGQVAFTVADADGRALLTRGTAEFAD